LAELRQILKLAGLSLKLLAPLLTIFYPQEREFITFEIIDDENSIYLICINWRITSRDIILGM
jgi:hypothetical protein